MLDNSNIEIKITNSAKLLECNYKDNELFQNNSKKKHKKLKKDNRAISSFYHKVFLLKQKYPKILLFFEKYAQFYFNYKYSTDANFYSIKVINDIIGNEPTHVVAEFKDYLIYGDDSEFLHSFYNKEDSQKYLPKIFDYYNKCSVIFPNYVVFPESKYIFKNIKKKQKVIDIQQEQEYKKELLLKGEIDYDDNDDLFTTRAIFTILNQTNTSNIRIIFGVDKNSKTYENIELNKNNENDNNNLINTSTKKLIDILQKEIKKKKEKKEQKTKIIKTKQILNLKNTLNTKMINNNMDSKMNNKGRNNQINEAVINFDNKNNKDNNNFYYTNINFKNMTLNKIKKNIHKPRIKSNSRSKIKSKEKQNSKMNNNFINYKNSNIDKAQKNNYIYSFITDSKANHISSTKKNIRTKSKIKNKNNAQLHNNSSGKNKKTIKEYFKRKISPKAIIIKMIIENNKNRLTSSRNGSKNKKENFNNKKKPVSLTPSLTNINMISHKTKKIYNRNVNSIVNIKQKNKIFKKKTKMISNDKKFKSLIMKDRNNSNSNYNPDTANTNNNNFTNNILQNNIISNNTNENNLTTYNNNRSSGNNITRNDISMNLYKVNSFSNIQKAKKTKKYSKIKANKHNSTLTGTTTCSYMKHSSIYYEKKTAKPIKRRHIFYQNEILLNDAYNKQNNKNKYYNNISKQFSINNNSNNNKINIKTENKNIKCFPKNMLSPSPSIGFINNKKDLLYEKLIRRKIGILPIKKTYFNLKNLGSSFTSRIRLDTSRTRMMKNTINIDKMYSMYRKKRKIDFKNLKNKSYNLKSVKIIKEQINNSINNKRMYLNTYYDFYNSKK